MSLPVIPAGKCISHILIKVLVLSVEIKDCTFKLSITLRLSGLNRPSDSNQVFHLIAHCYLTSFHFYPRWRSAFHTQRKHKLTQFQQTYFYPPPSIHLNTFKLVINTKRVPEQMLQPLRYASVLFHTKCSNTTIAVKIHKTYI